MPKAIPIFRPGKRRALNGKEYDISFADCAASAACYSTDLHRAPLVKGHPSIDLPAYGYAGAIDFDAGAGLLSATPEKIVPEFAEEVAAGQWPGVSTSFFHPEHASNPAPGNWYVKHIGFIGAGSPSVKGMPAPAFADGEEEDGVVCFADPVPLPESDTRQEDRTMSGDKKPAGQADQEAAFAEREARLKADADAIEAQRKEVAGREAALAEAEKKRRHEENVSFAEKLVTDNHLAPRLKGKIAAFLDAEGAAADDEVSFAEGDETKQLSAGALRRELLAELADEKNRVPFGERLPGSANDHPPADFAAPDDYITDPGQLALYRKAKAYQAEHPETDFEAAVAAVSR